jgi:hypothetical protein
MFDTLMKKASNLGIFSWGMLKLYLVTVGILLGTYFSAFFLNIIAAVWVIAVITFIYMIYLFFLKK